MKRVLIVDDALTIRMYHRKLLQDAGFEVGEATNGVEAMEKALQQSYDLFLVDINMPRMDGISFTAELREHPALCSIPVIIISTETKQTVVDSAYRAGANLYVVKPIRPEQLQANIRMLTGEAA